MGKKKTKKEKPGGAYSIKRMQRKMLVKKVIENVENDGKLSVSKAARDLKMKNFARNPQRITKSMEWRDLMDEFIPDDLLARTHSELLTAGEIQHYVFPAIIKNKKIKSADPDAEGSTITTKVPEAEALPDDEIQAIIESVPGCKLIYIRYEPFLGGKVAYYQAPDSKSRKDALDMGYKLRGKYAAEKLDVRSKYSDLSNSELAERIGKLRAYLTKKQK